MIAFWICAGLLGAIALALVLRPLLSRRRGGVSRSDLNLAVYRDQLRELDSDLRAGILARADYDRSRRELEQRLLQDVDGESAAAAPSSRQPSLRWMGIAAGVGIPLLALVVYFATGNPGALDPSRQIAQGTGMKDIEAMVQRLADRLEQNPEDVQGWKMLGKSYRVMGRFDEAATAYAKAAIRAPHDAQLLADLADALAMARGQNMTGEPEDLVLRALQIDPRNLKALALAGTAAFDRKDYPGAARFWERMLPLVPEDSEDRRTAQANVDEARALAKQRVAGRDAAKKAEPGTKAEAGQQAASAALQGTVSLSPKLAGNASPEDTVFIFARAAEGPPMPLAVLRRKARELPVKFSLDDSMAMTPAMKLSGFPRVVVGARISKTGDAAPQAGDLQGLSAAVANTARGVNVVIDTELPKK